MEAVVPVQGDLVPRGLGVQKWHGVSLAIGPRCPFWPGASRRESGDTGGHVGGTCVFFLSDEAGVALVWQGVPVRGRRQVCSLACLLVCVCVFFTWLCMCMFLCVCVFDLYMFVFVKVCV